VHTLCTRLYERVTSWRPALPGGGQQIAKHTRLERDPHFDTAPAAAA
jgi:hypothetical protein